MHGLCNITCYVLATENGKGNQGLIIPRHGQIFSTYNIEQRHNRIKRVARTSTKITKLTKLQNLTICTLHGRRLYQSYVYKQFPNCPPCCTSICSSLGLLPSTSLTKTPVKLEIIKYSDVDTLHSLSIFSIVNIIVQKRV